MTPTILSPQSVAFYFLLAWMCVIGLGLLTSTLLWLQFRDLHPDRNKWID